MKPPALLMLQTLISLSLFSFVANQVCDEGSYTVINEPRRSTQAVHTAGADTPLCDYQINEGTWFRFSSYTGDAVVERAINDPVPVMHCGTEIPIYIRGTGSHPTTDYGITTATVCANYGGNNTCDWTNTIQIYRCPVQGDPSYFYLYKLKSPAGCSLSYCAGEEFACNQGDYWNGDECVNYIPAMKAFPLFSGPHIKGSNLSAEIFFSCEVQYDRQQNDSNARFRVTFLFDGLSLENIGVNATRPPEDLKPITLSPESDLTAILDESHLRGRLGREISCQAVSYWDGNRETSSIMMSVALYYAAFESTAHSYSVSLTNGSTFKVTFQSTLPLTCTHCVDKGNDAYSCCEYRFRMEGSASVSECSLVWKDIYTAAVTAYFVPGATKTMDSFTLSFSQYVDDEASARGKSLWRDYAIPTIGMTILPDETQYKSCQSITDPHVTTFDGVYFNNYLLGDFYLTKAESANKSIEIQVRHETCNIGRDVTCNCGLVVREGNSAFKISICEAGTWSSTVQRTPTVVRLLSQDPEDAAAVYVDGTGLIYSVRMPSGLRVEADLRIPYSSVYVYLPPEFHGKTKRTSICGNSNGNRNDDFTQPDAERFRVPDDLSYFRFQPPCSSSFNAPATRCGCNDTDRNNHFIQCSNQDPTVEKISAADDPFTANWTSGVVCRKPQANAIASLLFDNSNNDFILDNNILFPPYTYDPNFGVNVSFTWPTPKLKTEQEVEQYCSDMLKLSPAYADCSATIDLATLVQMCVSDVQIEDDWLPESAYTFFFEQSCLNTMAASITNRSDSTNDVLTTVSGKLCPNQCSGNGTCSNGTCTCNPGNIGADCSIDETLPPSLTGAIRGGMCDVSKRPCDVISVYGSGVASSSVFKCRFTDRNTGAHVETNGTFITALEYSCPVPETTTHRRRRSVATRTTALSPRKVSITVNGVLYSNALDFLLFDSVCMDCNSTGNCRQKDESCLISDGCYADNAINPDDSCLQCVPSVSRNSWKDIAVVESWKLCTRSCDLGVATRSTVCSSKIVKKEVEFCEVKSCPDNAEQKTHGFGITLSSEDLKLILEDPVGSLVPFADALNQYCSKNSAACCNSVGIPSRISGVTYTSPELLTYASGYPVVDNTDNSLKIIAKIDLAKFGAECSQTQNQGSNIVYADAKLIYDAVNSEKSKIEQALSITITSVWSGNSRSSALRSSTSVSIIYNLIGFWMFIILVQSNLA